MTERKAKSKSNSKRRFPSGMTTRKAKATARAKARVRALNVS
jgi:hypothetical protein